MIYRHSPILFLLAFTILFVPSAYGQHTYRAVVQDEHEREPLAGVNVIVEGTTIGTVSNAEGQVEITGIPTGEQTIVFSFIGFESTQRTLLFPLPNADQPDLVLLEKGHEELEEIAVMATRTSRTIADSPTRVETIAGEEIDEKISMEPSNITMLLNESPGITVQQTSAVSGGASIRIQGLDGRYTQLLKDGFPLYGGFSGGLSLLQIPPLDLMQVEIIKGPSSTLYGGDAIAGLVNLVSKQPTEDPELNLLANGTSAGGLDIGSFYTARGEKTGITILASGNLQQVYDPDDDLFSNLPKSRRLSLNPKLYFYPIERTTISFGLTGTFEEREGGDIDAIKDGPSGEQIFVERNESTRLTSQGRLDLELQNGGHFILKNSVSHFDRAIEVPGYRFDGRQLATYSEVSLLLAKENHDVVLGVDLRSDAFREEAGDDIQLRDYTYASAGAFAQDSWDISEHVVMETGLRAEYHNEFGLFVLPKASLLFKANDALTMRFGGGLGYKAPSVFLEPSEERTFRDVLPLGDDIDAETSQGGSMDFNYRTILFDRLTMSLNQAFYFTNLQNPLVPQIPDETGTLSYRNADGTIRTRALETNVKFSLGDMKLFLGYVYLNAQRKYDGISNTLPLTPTHKTYTVLVYEQHGKTRIGLEAYYTSSQELALPEQRTRVGIQTNGYWILGLMAERRFGRARLFLNFENFLDTKQSNYSPVVIGPRANPRFEEIWAPMDGFIINGGIKYTL